MVAILRQYHRSLTQEYINHVLRPSESCNVPNFQNYFKLSFLKTNYNFIGKQKFPRGRIEGAKEKMRILGATKLKSFSARPQTIFDTYYDFDKNRNVPNFRIPPIGRSIRVTDLEGKPICIGRRHVRRGRFRLCYRKSTYEQQRLHAFELLDKCFSILKQVGEFF